MSRESLDLDKDMMGEAVPLRNVRLRMQRPSSLAGMCGRHIARRLIR